jgi:hypothetical protein
VLHQKVGIPAAGQDLFAIWQPDEVWTKFIRSSLEPVHNFL